MATWADYPDPGEDMEEEDLEQDREQQASEPCRIYIYRGIIISNKVYVRMCIYIYIYISALSEQNRHTKIGKITISIFLHREILPNVQQRVSIEF